MEKNEKLNIWEQFIIAAILLVIVQTFLDEFARFMHWSVITRNGLLIAGLIFDLIFSIEFITRTVLAKKRGSIRGYWLYERGWVDFICSFPLLILDSGPSVFFLAVGGVQAGGAAIGILNVLKVVKAIRITRILRLVRIVKIFGKIHNAESKMAQHHTASIATTGVFSVILTLFLFNIITSGITSSRLDQRRMEYVMTLEKLDKVYQEAGMPRKSLLKQYFTKDSHLLKLRYDDSNLISNITDAKLLSSYTNDDYITVVHDKFELQVSIVDLNKETALQHMQSFFIIVVMVLLYMILYTRHFVQNISDIVHILNKGFRKKDYTLQIKIPEHYEDHEIFRLAKYYNNAYLPAKMKRIHASGDKKSAEIPMKDLNSFGKKGADE